MIRELWDYRELVYFLAWRDVKVRYKQTVLGVLWAGLQPFFTMVVFTLLFGQLAKIPTDGIPGPIFYFSALVPWTYFSSTVNNAGMSLASNSGLLTKIYFPRIILPAAAAISTMVDFLISSVFLVGFIIYYKFPFGWSLLLWPVLVALLMMLAFSLGTFFSALNVKYRDVRYALPFLIQLLLFATPIIYPSSMISERYQWLLALNPLSGIIEAFRCAVVPSLAINWHLLGLSAMITCLFFVVGVAYFRRTRESVFRHRLRNPATVTNSIEIRNLSKRYRLGKSQHGQMIRERLIELLKNPLGRRAVEEESIWALRDVSFDVREGEVVGIIGRNGAGKSTLLKLLSRITYPTSGTVKVRGRVSALLEVGTGFHDELTGRENIYLNGSILGMRKREVDARFDAIVDFSGVEQFLDTPIKHYSSGMRLRLGFAVAAHLEPDVLIVDEVLAVGDAGFQKKCIKAMEGLQSSGRTVLFVSHNLAAVENLCSRGIWIDSGKIRMDAGTQEVITSYMGSFVGERVSGSDLSGSENRIGNGEIRYTKLEFLSLDGMPCAMTRSGDGLVIRFHYHANTPIRDPSFGFRLFTEMGTLITEAAHWMHGIHIPGVPAGDGYIDVEIASLNLVPGQYSFSLWITGPAGKPIYDGDVRASLEVEVSDVYGAGRMLNSSFGIVYFPQRWKLPRTM